jgi:hypothetical protein
VWRETEKLTGWSEFGPWQRNLPIPSRGCAGDGMIEARRPPGLDLHQDNFIARMKNLLGYPCSRGLGYGAFKF